MRPRLHQYLSGAQPPALLWRDLEVCRSAMVPIAAKVERQNILFRGATSSQLLRSPVALVKQEHSRTRLARREVGRLEHSSVWLGQIHHPWCGCLPGENPFIHERVPRGVSGVIPAKIARTGFTKGLWGLDSRGRRKHAVHEPTEADP